VAEAGERRDEYTVHRVPVRPAVVGDHANVRLRRAGSAAGVIPTAEITLRVERGDFGGHHSIEVDGQELEVIRVALEDGLVGGGQVGVDPHHAAVVEALQHRFVPAAEAGEHLVVLRPRVTHLLRDHVVARGCGAIDFVENRYCLTTCDPALTVDFGRHDLVHALQVGLGEAACAERGIGGAGVHCIRRADVDLVGGDAGPDRERSGRHAGA
jgi:hypothetical protein